MHIQSIADRIRCRDKHDPRDCIYCEAAHWIELLSKDVHFDTYNCGHAFPNGTVGDRLFTLPCSVCHKDKL